MRAIPPKRKPITKEEKERASKKRKQTLKEKYGKLISLKDLSLELNRDFTWLYFLTKNLNIRINGKHNCYVKKESIEILKKNLERKGVSIEKKKQLIF